MHFHVASLAKWPRTATSKSPPSAIAIRPSWTAPLKSYPQLAGKKLTVYNDQRKLFDDKSIDAVCFATQDHWHALQTIWACQAGKDVYVEKPATHDIWEGRENGRGRPKVQAHGPNRHAKPLQPQRHGGHSQAERGRDRQALHGPRHVLQDARATWASTVPARCPQGSTGTPGWGRPRWSTIAASIITAGTGSRTSPAATSPTRPSHDVDVIRWGLGLDTHPNLMMSLGGRYLPAEDDDADTPNTQGLLCQWEDRNLQVSFEVRHWYTNSEAGCATSIRFSTPTRWWA